MNAGSLLARILRMRNRHLRYNRHSIVAESEIESLVNEAGFEIECSYGFWYVPPFRDRLILPASLMLSIEKKLFERPGLQAWAKDRIYVCRPV
jgi:hypothetical protein